MVPGNPDILMSGKLSAPELGATTLNPWTEYLGCFAGGMFALGGKLLHNEGHVDVGRRLIEGCFWAYNATLTGIMPEDVRMFDCSKHSSCEWNETVWWKSVQEQNKTPSHVSTLPKGVTFIPNTHYILRPEAIESVFILYRVTGSQQYADAAWRMFEAIPNATNTDLANSATYNVTNQDGTRAKMDQMENFWLAETLKYFYLVFSEPTLVDLDEWVFNTEAHPFRRPRPRGWWWGGWAW